MPIHKKEQEVIQENSNNKLPEENNTPETSSVATKEKGGESSVDSDSSEKDEKIKELEGTVKRLYADFENFRKRQDEESVNIRKYASERFMTELLPVLDNFERALAASEVSNDYTSLKSGLEMVNKQFREVLCKEGLTEVCSIGKPFDPEVHQVVQCQNDDSCDEDTILMEVQKGYKIYDRLIRPSMVIVSKKSINSEK